MCTTTIGLEEAQQSQATGFKVCKHQDSGASTVGLLPTSRPPQETCRALTALFLNTLKSKVKIEGKTRSGDENCVFAEGMAWGLPPLPRFLSLSRVHFLLAHCSEVKVRSVTEAEVVPCL